MSRVFTKSTILFAQKRIIFSVSSEPVFLSCANVLAIFNDSSHGSNSSVIYGYKPDSTSNGKLFCLNNIFTKYDFENSISFKYQGDPNKFKLTAKDNLEIFVLGHGADNNKSIYSTSEKESAYISAFVLQEFLVSIIKQHLEDSDKENLMYFELNLLMCFGEVFASELQRVFLNNNLFPLIKACREYQIIDHSNGRHEITSSEVDRGKKQYRGSCTKLLFYYGVGVKGLEPRVNKDLYSSESQDLIELYRKASILGKPL